MLVSIPVLRRIHTAVAVFFFLAMPLAWGRSSGDLIPAVDTASIVYPVEDGAGVVWAIGWGSPRTLQRWSRAGWQNVPSSIPRAEPVGIWPADKGGVLVQWDVLGAKTGAAVIFQWRRGDRVRVIAHIPAAQLTRIAANLIVTSVAPTKAGLLLAARLSSAATDRLYRIGQDGTVARIYSFHASQYLPSTESYRFPLPLRMTTDPTGRVWIWNGWSKAGDPPGVALQGFVLADGHGVQYHRDLPGLASHHWASLDVWDDHHLAVASLNDGLYSIDLATLTATRIPEPVPGAFRFVQKVFRVGGDRYVVTFGPTPLHSFLIRDLDLQTGTVWRERNGQWKELLHGIGDTSGAALATADGLWLGGATHALWFLDSKDKARRIDWRQGLPLSAVEDLFALPDGDILAMQADGYVRAAEVRPEALLQARPDESHAMVVSGIRSLEPDGEGHLWGLADSGLQEWTGSRWVRHPFPPRLLPHRLMGVDVDQNGRVWLFPNCHMGPMGIFDPRGKDWSVYYDYRNALVRQPGPVRFLHPQDDRLQPVYGPESQMAVFGFCGGVNYFDGRRWRLWNPGQLPGRAVPSIEAPPFFDAAGYFAVDLHDVTWQWTPSTGWKQIAFEPAHGNMAGTVWSAQSGSVPLGCQTPAPSSLVRDEEGRSWWVADDTLYEGVAGNCHAILSGAEAQPFLDGRQVARVLLDGKGNIFLGTVRPFGYVEIRKSDDRIPHPQMLRSSGVR